jgi:imidazole glycerol-phosphate synthase subunit HisF
MVRIIPRLDIKGPNLVKGIHLEGLRVLGNPSLFARYYYENGADELLFQDVVASLYQRNSLNEIITKTAKEVFIPLTVGGGLRTIDDIKCVLRAGADKVSINTAAINNPDFIKKASQNFGASTIVVALEVIKKEDGSYLCFTNNGREYSGIEALSWAQQVEALGAGELIVTSIDKDGTKKGMDLNLINYISSNVTIPVIAHGGVGATSDVVDAIQNNADAVSIASVLHYNFLQSSKDQNLETKEGNNEFLNKNLRQMKHEVTSLSSIKSYLSEKSIPCRSLS